MPSAQDMLIEAVEKIRARGWLALIVLSALLVYTLAQNSCASTEDTAVKPRQISVRRRLAYCVNPGVQKFDRELFKDLQERKITYLNLPLDKILESNKTCRVELGKEELDLTRNCDAECDGQANSGCCPIGTLLIPILDYPSSPASEQIQNKPAVNNKLSTRKVLHRDYYYKKMVR